MKRDSDMNTKPKRFCEENIIPQWWITTIYLTMREDMCSGYMTRCSGNGNFCPYLKAIFATT